MAADINQPLNLGQCRHVEELFLINPPDQLLLYLEDFDLLA